MSELKYSIGPTYLYTLERHRKEPNKVQKMKENKPENILGISYNYQQYINSSFILYFYTIGNFLQNGMYT